MKSPIETLAPVGQISVGVELLSTQWENCFTSMKRKKKWFPLKRKEEIEYTLLDN